MSFFFFSRTFQTDTWKLEADSTTTHLLHQTTTAASASTDPTSASDFFRTISLSSGRNPLALIHVWYRPDSYDTWLPSKDFPQPEEEPVHQGVWKVESRWLEDGILFNETMNEEDYEITEETENQTSEAVQEGNVEKGQISRTGTGNSRKRSLPETVSDFDEEGEEESNASKRIKLLVPRRPTGATSVDVSNPNSGLAPGRRWESEAIPGGTIGNLPSEGGDVTMQDGESNKPSETDPSAKPVISVAQDLAAQNAASSHLESSSKSLASRYLASQTQPIIVPSHSLWYSTSTITPLEKRSLPEFFNGKSRSKTPSIYKGYRDFMIDTYRLNPSEYLTFTACRRNLAGDVCAIMRVHAFLECWGLINYQVSIRKKNCMLLTD